jgi:proteasome assembly chaperone (PAC2) family protein
MKIDMTSIEERAKEAQQIFSQVQRMTEQNIEEARGTRDDTKPGYIG